MARVDQPEGDEGLQVERLAGSGDLEALRQQLKDLPQWHPSSPEDSPGTETLRTADAGPSGDEPSRGVTAQDAAKSPPPETTPDADHGTANPPDGNGESKPPEEPGRRRLTPAEHIEHVAEVRDALDKARGAGLMTNRLHTIDPKNVVWSSERDEQHDAIIDDMYAKAAGVPCEHKAIIAGGLPGAGKSTILGAHAGIDRSQYLTINPDDIKEEMASREMIPPVEGLSPMEASDLAHEESSYLATQLALRAEADGKNLIWDITMSSRESTERRINELRSSGYEQVDGIFVDIPVETSVARADGRHKEGQDMYWASEGLGGRFVPAELIEAQADPEWGSRNRKTFEEVKHHFSTWFRFDNSGATPVLAESGHREEDA